MIIRQSFYALYCGKTKGKAMQKYSCEKNIIFRLRGKTNAILFMNDLLYFYTAVVIG